MVARRAGMMFVFLITAQSLLIIHLAGSVINALAGKQQNEENSDNDKRHKIRGFLSFLSKKSPGEPFPEAEAIISRFRRKEKHATE